MKVYEVDDKLYATRELAESFSGGSEIIERPVIGKGDGPSPLPGGNTAPLESEEAKRRFLEGLKRGE